jgi:serine/threonine-protein kinase
VAAGSFGLAIGAGATALVILALLLGLGAALWQAGRAREQARRARVEGRTAEAVKRFLLDIFETNSHNQADPQKAQQTTARELLDIGLSRIATSLRDEPEARISVLETLSEMYYQIGLRSDALRLQREATDLARATFGPNDLRFARIALTCAQWFEGSAKRHEVPALLEEARAALLASGQAMSPLQGKLLLELALHYRYESLPKTLQMAERAVLVLRHSTDSSELSNAFRAAGRAQIGAGNFRSAEQHYRHAVALAAKEDGSTSAWSVNAYAELAEVLFRQARLAESLDWIRTASDASTRTHGAQHRWTLVIKIRMSNQLLLTGMIDEAMALRTEVEQALALDRPEYDAQFRADMAGYFGDLLIERGRPDLAEPLLRKDLEDLREHFPRSGAVAARGALLAEALVAFGRYDDARALVDEAMAIWQRFSGGAAQPVCTMKYQIASARVYLAQGRPDDAREVLSSCALPASAADGRFDVGVLHWAAECARAELALGRPEIACDLASAEIDTMHAQFRGTELSSAQARLHLERGRARQVLGDFDGACKDLRTALARRQRFDDSGSLWLAEVQIALANCLGAIHGEPASRSSREAQQSLDEAQALLGEAQRIHTLHREVGPHLALPLRRALAAA